MRRLWKWLAAVVVLAIAGLSVLVFSAGLWLETPTGRKLLQRELGNGLGLQTTLSGDYQLEVFPQVQIAGDGLDLRVPGTTGSLAEIQSYAAHLAFWPLLRKEVLVRKLEMHHGSLDVDLLAAMGGDKPKDKGTTMHLPRIEAMAINDLRLHRSGAELLEIARLGLQDFAAGEDASLSLAVRFPGEDGSGLLIELDGAVNIQAAPLEVAVQVDGLAATINDERLSLGKGDLSWSSRQQLAGKLQGQWAGFTGHYDFSLATGEPLHLRLGLQLESETAGMLEAQLKAHEQSGEQSGTWLVDVLELDLEGQHVAGTGCLDMQDGTKLQLELTAAKLDLDALQGLVPESVAGPEGSTPNTDLSTPIQLAVQLRVDEARMSGAIARDVRLLLGEAPDCKAAGEVGAEGATGVGRS